MKLDFEFKHGYFKLGIGNYVDEIELYGEEGFQVLSAKEANALLELKSQIEFMGDGSLETGFELLVEDAKAAQECFLKIKKMLKLGSK